MTLDEVYGATTVRPVAGVRIVWRAPSWFARALGWAAEAVPQILLWWMLFMSASLAVAR